MYSLLYNTYANRITKSDCKVQKPYYCFFVEIQYISALQIFLVKTPKTPLNFVYISTISRVFCMTQNSKIFIVKNKQDFNA